MKKLSILLATLMLCATLSACQDTPAPATPTTTAPTTESTLSTTVSTGESGETTQSTTFAPTESNVSQLPSGETTTQGIVSDPTLPTNTTASVAPTVPTEGPATEGITIPTTQQNPIAPTTETTVPAEKPTVAPTVAPTDAPTVAPTVAPTDAPTVAPTVALTEAPTTTTTTITPTTGATLSPADDRAWQENPGSLYEPKDSKFDAQANALKTAMNKLPDTLKPGAGGTVYYVSEKHGNNSNNGTSKATPLQTVDAVRTLPLKAGDVVLFERGGLYRVPRQLNLASGVSYGAYGTGDRPLIYGSSRNYAQDTWTEVSPNVWALNATFGGDVGCVVFNHGEKWAQWVETKADLNKEMEFFCDTAIGNKVYLYTTTNPNGAYRSIEIGHDGQLFNFDGKTDIVIENLTFKYTGGHAVRGSATKRVTVRGCEFGFIGGSILYVQSGEVTRYGNAVEFIGGNDVSTVENCWFYQIYDSATTCQGSGTSNKFTLRNSLAEYVGMGTYEYWGVTHKDTLIEGNVMRWAGYGMGGNKGNNGSLRAHIQSNAKVGGSGGILLENFVVKNNIFDQSAYQLLNFCYSSTSTVTVDGNTYVQVENNRRRPLGYLGQTTDQHYFDDTAANTIKTVLGDQNATVLFAK